MEAAYNQGALGTEAVHLQSPRWCLAQKLPEGVDHPLRPWFSRGCWTGAHTQRRWAPLVTPTPNPAPPLPLGYKLLPQDVEQLLSQVALGGDNISQSAFLASQVDWWVGARGGRREGLLTPGKGFLGTGHCVGPCVGGGQAKGGGHVQHPLVGRRTCVGVLGSTPILSAAAASCSGCLRFLMPPTLPAFTSQLLLLQRAAPPGCPAMCSCLTPWPPRHSSQPSPAHTQAPRHSSQPSAAAARTGRPFAPRSCCRDPVASLKPSSTRACRIPSAHCPWPPRHDFQHNHHEEWLS